MQDGGGVDSSLERRLLSLGGVEEPRVSNQFWQFLTNMQIPVNTTAISHRNHNLIVPPEQLINSERDLYAAVKKNNEHGSSFDGMNINSQTRTGYQTSEQQLHE